MKTLITVVISDFKMIFRDPSLRIFLVVPFILILVVNFLVPHLVGLYDNALNFVPYIIMGATLQTSTMFGFIYSMVFIDEKDTRVSSVYGILPISKILFVIFRLILAFLFSTGFTFLILYVQPFYQFLPFQILLVSILAGIIGPSLAVAVSNLSANKMAGMTWYKLINLLIMLPLLAFFVPAYSIWFGIIPTHWLFQSINNLIQGQAYFWGILIGVFYSLLLISFLSHYFSKNHYM